MTEAPLPKDVVENICQFSRHEEVLTKWEVLVGLRRKYECCKQHFRHCWILAQKYPDYVIICDLVPLPEWENNYEVQLPIRVF